MSILELRDVEYAYLAGQPVLKGISMGLELGRVYAVLGPSGCGKTTLLALMGGLDFPSAGTVLFDGIDIKTTGLPQHRRDHVSFIFQSYNLIDYMTAAENIRLTSNKDPWPALENVGLTRDEAGRNVLKLSGGQQQRVAIARALHNDNPVILADEPTGNLDEDTAADITQLLLGKARESCKCVVIVTHSRDIASQADVVFRLSDGVVAEERDLMHHE